MSALCINDYTVVIDSIYRNYERGKVEFDILNEAIFQSNHISLDVIKNYANSNLRKILDTILTSKKIEISNSSEFKKWINNIISGQDWSIMKDSEKLEPPFINYRKCE